MRTITFICGCLFIYLNNKLIGAIPYNIKHMICPHCKNDDVRLIEILIKWKDRITYFCSVCSKRFDVKL